MPAKKRFKTKYRGVYYIEGKAPDGRLELIYYIHYRKGGKLIEEKAGRQFKNDMTPARAARARTLRIHGDAPTNQERREAARQTEDTWTFDRLWLEYKNRRPNLKGLVTDENRYQNYIKPLMGNREPKTLTPSEVDNLRVRLLKTHEPGTVKNILELLRRLVNFAAKKHICEAPSFTIEMPTVNNIKTEDLTPEQLAALLEAIEQDPNIQAANFMKMALFTGLRRGELFKLMWDDVDFERGFIYIRDPKGGRDENIPLNTESRELLTNHPRSESPYVFPGRHGRQRVDIAKQVNRIKRAAGLPKDFRALHGLRHVYASMLASSGQVDLYTLQKLLTHKSPAMTMRYAHLRDETLRKASGLTGPLIREAISGGKGKKG
jgi:integrase